MRLINDYTECDRLINQGVRVAEISLRTGIPEMTIYHRRSAMRMSRKYTLPDLEIFDYRAYAQAFMEELTMDERKQLFGGQRE